jgi:sialate O-acetylesterase
MMFPLRSLLAGLLCTLCLLASTARAEVRVAPLFADGAVLQRDKPILIWGAADRGEKVTVSFAGQRREATPDAQGRWLVLLDPMSATGEGADLIIAGKNTLTLRDVVVGEVWLCAGQSNMEWPVSRSDRAADEIAAANFPLVREIKIDRTVAEQPADFVKTTGWRGASPATVGEFSAVAYFFARELHTKLGVPIGIVNCTWGGTPIEAWMSEAALASAPDFRVVDERWAQAQAAYPAKKAEFEAAEPVWQKAFAAVPPTKAARDAFLLKNPRPRAPIGGQHHPWMPRGLFNGMIHPLLPASLRGIAWYQGENNVERAAEYRALFSALIVAWRAHLGQGDVPFFWVNLAGFRYPSDPTGIAAAALREAQTQTLTLPNTGQAIAIDIGAANDIHPTNKQEVSRRLALLAKHRVYGFVGDDMGPVFASATREPLAAGTAALRVRFTHAGNGLIAYYKPVQSLQVAGADRVFHPAEARIDRDTLLVFSRAVREPVAVRYAWSNAPEANLYNGVGLPATPFRSDEW